jgi:hypothetical protein
MTHACRSAITSTSGLATASVDNSSAGAGNSPLREMLPPGEGEGRLGELGVLPMGNLLGALPMGSVWMAATEPVAQAISWDRQVPG